MTGCLDKDRASEVSSVLQHRFLLINGFIEEIDCSGSTDGCTASWTRPGVSR